MLTKSQLKFIINRNYPAPNHGKSCNLCAKDLGYGHQTIWKSCNEESYPIREALCKYLTVKDEKRIVEFERNEIQSDRKEIKETKQAITNLLQGTMQELSNSVDKTNNALAKIN